MRRLTARALVPAALVLLGCQESVEPDRTYLPAYDDGAILSLAQHSVMIDFLESSKLTVTRTDSSGAPKPAPILWRTRAEGLASVDTAGTVTAIGVGVTWIVVSDGRHQDSARVTATARYLSLHAGTDFTCGLTTRHVPLCWGWNEYGTLGNGTYDDTLTPVPVLGAPSYAIMTTGGGTSCGTTGFAVDCWGYNGAGQLGDGTVRTRNHPVHVGDTLGFASVTVGAGTNACARGMDGSMICWGSNGWGQLLLGDFVNPHKPTVLNSGIALHGFATGGGHVCGLDSTGTPWCWGRDDIGQAGGSGDVVFQPRMIEGAPPFVSMVSGVAHACGRTADGHVWCWGDNARHQLGVEGPAFSTVPVLAAGGMTFDTVTTSAFHTCGLVSHVAWCWGDDLYGQLGRRSSAGSHSDAEPVFGNLQFASITTGVGHTCGITLDGVAWCWGHNEFGALGTGNRLDQNAPVRVMYQ